ncbi:MAG TPA: hypothetical protein VGK26_08580 [Thermoanaerobaculia bacterium]
MSSASTGAAPAPAPASARFGLVKPALLFVGLMLVLYADPLFVRRNFAGRDLNAYNLPMEKTVHDAWARDEWPVWSTEVSGGRPLLPNPNAGATYPVRLLLSRLAFPLAFRVYPVLHWIVAGLGMLVLCRASGRSAAASWLAAVTYVFSGVGVAELFYPHIHPGMALLPWIVWAAARRSGTPASRFLVLTILFALDLLAADVFTITLAILCAAAWIALEDPPLEPVRAAGGLALAVAVGALAAAPQIVATMAWIPLTNRGIVGMKLSDVLLFSIHPWRLLELVVPFPFGAAWKISIREMWAQTIFHGKSIGLFPTLYAGAFAVMAVPIAWRSGERGVRFARVVLVAALASSVLPSLLPASWQKWSSPLPLRNPEKFAVAIVFALALFVALAADAWTRRPGSLHWPNAAGAVLAAAAAACAWDPAGAARVALRAVGNAPALAERASAQLPSAFAEAGLLWMASVIALGLLSRPERRGGIAVALLLLTLVPVLANRRIARSFREEEVFAPTAFARYQTKNDPRGFYRAVDESLYRHPSELAMRQFEATLSDLEFTRRTWYDQSPVLFGRGTVFNEDFDAGDLSRVESLRRVSSPASGFGDADAFFGSFALKWGIRYRDQEPLPGYRAIGGDALQAWDEHPGAFPDIRFAERWVEAPSALEGLRALPTLAPGEILVETGTSRKASSRPGAVRVLERRPERLEIDVDSPDGGWLFVLRAFWPYRTILLDGRPVEAVPAQLAFCAVPVPPGRHHVRWVEEVPGWSASRFGPILFVIVAGVAAAATHRSARRLGGPR